MIGGSDMLAKWKRLLLVTTLMVSSGSSLAISAQTSDTVAYQIEVKQNFLDRQAEVLENLSFDIISKATNTVVFSYRPSTTEEPEKAILEPGEYILRVYDWDMVSQNGQFISDELTQTIANPTPEEAAEGELAKELSPGEVVTLADGKVVYDVSFKVEIGTGVYDEASQSYQGELNFFIATPEVAQANNDQDQKQEIHEEEEVQDDIAETEESVQGTGQYEVKVVDQLGNPVSGAHIQFNNQELATNEQGIVQYNEVPVGEYTMKLVKVPEGYLLEEQVENSIVIQSNVLITTEIVVPQYEPEAEKAKAIFSIYDDQAAPVSGVGILIEGVELVSDENGQIVVPDLVSGEYTYTVTTLPNGYIGTNSGTFTIDAVTGDTTINIALEKTVEVGSVRFSVVNSQNEPVSDVSIEFLNTFITSSEDGTALVQGVTIGEHAYQVVNVPDGYQIPENGVVMVEQSDTPVEVVLRLENNVTTGTVNIEVVDGEKHPVAGVSGTLDSGENFTTNESGKATLESVEEGSRTLVISNLPEGYQLKESTIPIEVTANEAINVTIELEAATTPTQKVTMTLVDQFNQPISQAKIQLAEQTVVTDEQGKAVFEEIPVGEYVYKIEELPELFAASVTGELSVSQENPVDETVTIERSIKTATTEINVVDQDNKGIEGVTIQFGGLSGKTDANGKVVFDNLQPGKYYVKALDGPEGVEITQEESEIQVAEGDAISTTLKYTRNYFGKVVMTLKDNEGKPVKNMAIEIGDKQYETDSNGQVIIEQIAQGKYPYRLILNEPYTANATEGELEVQANQESQLEIVIQKVEETTVQTTQETTTNSQETTTQTTQATTTQDSQTTELVTETTVIVQETLLKQLIDSTTNIEVWLYPQDYERVAKLSVEKITKDIPSALSNKETDIYSIQLLDANNNAITPQNPIQIKIPVRAVNEQLQTVRVINDNSFVTMNTTLVNQRINFNTQQLGTFAIIYGNKAVTTVANTTSEVGASNVNVSTVTSVESDLPRTGEVSNTFKWIAVACIALAAGIILPKSQKRLKDNN